MTRVNGGAKKLADTIEGVLASATGPMNIPFDQIRILLAGSTTMTLDDAAAFIEKHLTTALDILVERGWSATKYTAYWDRIGHVVPTSEVEIRKCIAGIGYASKAVGLHFVLGVDDWLFIYARDHGARVWRGKRRAELDRLDSEAQAGKLTTTGIVIAERSAADPNIGDKAYTKLRKGTVAAIKP